MNAVRSLQKNHFVRRRTIHMRRILLCMIFALFFISTGMILGNSFSAAAKNTGEMRPALKYYTSIQVKDGDSLWSIASKYATPEYYDSYEEYIEEVMNMNHLTEATIHATQYLTIPYYLES